MNGVSTTQRQPHPPPMPIIDELLREFPDLAPQKQDIEKIIAAMERSDRPPALDDAFVQRLRSQLLATPPLAQPFHQFFFSHMQQKTFVFLGAVLALCILTPAGFALWKMNSFGSMPTPAAQITMLDAGAFGDLSGATRSGVSDGKGGGGAEKMSATTIAVGEPYPYPYEPTVYVYTFAGNISDYLTDTTGTVYERAPFAVFAGSTLNGIASSVSGINLGPFLSGELTSFVLRARGMMLSLDVPNNTWSIYQDWSSVSSSDASSDAWTPLAASDLPSDDAIITTAKDFASSWDIDTTSYGTPVIAEPEVALARSGAAGIYVPESATVVFPVLVDEQTVYPSWSTAPTGLRISINLRNLSVINAYDALSQTYNASSYDLTQDATLVTSLISGGGSAPAVYEGTSIQEVSVELNAPERTLMEYSLYENGQSRTLFVPALRFTLKDPSQIPWTSGVITIPLVKSIAEQQGQSNIGGGIISPLLVK